MCKDIKTSIRLIYECKKVLQMWRLLDEYLSFDIEWKRIIEGFCLENNRKSATLNFVIFFIACKLYKYIRYCRLEKKDKHEEGSKAHLKLRRTNLEPVISLILLIFCNNITVCTQIQILCKISTESRPVLQRLSIGHVNETSQRGDDPYIRLASTCFDMIIFLLF